MSLRKELRVIITNDNINGVMTELKESSDLTHLEINRLPPLSIREQLFIALTENQTITSIKFDFRWDDLNEQQDFFKHLPQTFKNRLERFNYITRDNNQDLFETLIVFMINCPKLQAVELYCPIACGLLSTFIEFADSVKELKLASCYVGDAGAKVLVQGILESKSLQKLDLTNVGITNEGSVAIVEAITKQGKINDLSLRSNEIPQNKLKKIVDILIPNKTLKTLDLSFVEINDVGAFYIAELIKANQSIVNLNLQRCRFSTIGIERIEDALIEKNCCARVVDLSFNAKSLLANKKLYPAILASSQQPSLASMCFLASNQNLRPKPDVDSGKQERHERHRKVRS